MLFELRSPGDVVCRFINVAEPGCLGLLSEMNVDDESPATWLLLSSPRQQLEWYGRTIGSDHQSLSARISIERTARAAQR